MDEFDLARRALEDVRERARARGSAFAFALASTFLAVVSLLTGDLAAAEADARGAADVAAEHELGWLQALSPAYLAATQLERGDADAAGQTLARVGLGEEVPTVFPVQVFRFVRGRVRAAQGDLARGLADLRAIGRVMAALEIRSASEFPWRSEAALALLALGETEEARILTAAELEVARSWGAPRALGAGLRKAGLIDGGERGWSCCARRRRSWPTHPPGSSGRGCSPPSDPRFGDATSVPPHASRLPKRSSSLTAPARSPSPTRRGRSSSQRELALDAMLGAVRTP